MKLLFPFFAFFCFIFYSLLKRSTTSNEEDRMKFLEREQKANSTRRKSIDNLNYITIPYESLPFLANPSKNISEYEKEIRSFEGKQILNLSGMTNTTLKLTYGAPNLPILMDCDERFLRLSVLLDRWSKALVDEGYIDEAQTVLEFALDCNCDSGSIYIRLANIYAQKHEGNILAMIAKLKKSPSLTKDSTINKLKEILNSTEGR